MIKIEKDWKSLAGQRVFGDDGEVWDISELIERAKDLKVMEIPMEHLTIGSKIAGLRLRKFVSHMKMVLDADLSYPIILDEDGYILDGRHRMAKALLEGHETIKAVRFEEDPAPSYYKEEK
ncbi:MAG: hypothetical protein KAS32_02550 [Candidatus Peribacteraceae bacterium]|nr:hypothetical protein [Candidatus Peribacteraceae bacterium]